MTETNNTIAQEKFTSVKESRVRILADAIVNQIAAGEVVERPSSVIKELVENAIDAGATHIVVIADNGGKSRIEVRDNGCGMSREDALLAVERFGTSKIRDVDDLTSINTFGFRGEALPSIASVSRFTLRTGNHGRSGEVVEGAGYSYEVQNAGTEIYIDSGKLKSVSDIQVNAGTTVIVSHLFHNVPARRKFLRSDATESAQIKILLQDFALANAGLSFQLILDGREAMSFQPANGFLARAEVIVGGTMVGSGLETSGGADCIRVDVESHVAGCLIQLEALLSSPHACVSTSNKTRLFVNGRIVRDRLLLRAIREGYGAVLSPNQYPVGCMSMRLSPEFVDVNVHPQKTEVRFREPQAIISVVSGAIRRAVEGARVLRPITVDRRSLPQSKTSQYISDSGRFSVNDVYLQDARLKFNTAEADVVPAQSNMVSPCIEESQLFAEDLSPRSLSVAEAHLVPFASGNSKSKENQYEGKLGRLRYMGQVFQCFLLFSDDELFAIVDMHAAHERVMFYKLKNQFKGTGVQIQMLLNPEIIEVSPGGEQHFDISKEVISRFGFEYEWFGDNSIIVRGVPAILASGGQIDVRAIFRELDALGSYDSASDELERLTDAVIARLACHGSVRSGRQIKEAEAYALLDSMVETDSSAFCPHGRPVIRWFSQKELGALFSRT